MNNRYIFRGKRKDNGEWIEGDLIQWKNGNMQICLGVGLNKEQKTLVDIIPETVEQCSGIPDTNDDLMYEGDTVNVLSDYGKKTRAMCAFRYGSFGMLIREHGIKCFYPFYSLCDVIYEVIGNKHDIHHNGEIRRKKELQLTLDECPVKTLFGDNNLICSKTSADYEKLIMDISNDAIKEFAQRLKKSDELYNCIRAIGNVSKIDCLIDTFNNLVKEMTGDRHE